MPKRLRASCCATASGLERSIRGAARRRRLRFGGGRRAALAALFFFGRAFFGCAREFSEAVAGDDLRARGAPFPARRAGAFFTAPRPGPSTLAWRVRLRRRRRRRATTPSPPQEPPLRRRSSGLGRRRTSYGKAVDPPLLQSEYTSRRLVHKTSRSLGRGISRHLRRDTPWPVDSCCEGRARRTLEPRPRNSAADGPLRKQPPGSREPLVCSLPTLPGDSIKDRRRRCSRP